MMGIPYRQHLHVYSSIGIMSAKGPACVLKEFNTAADVHYNDCICRKLKILAA